MSPGRRWKVSDDRQLLATLRTGEPAPLAIPGPGSVHPGVRSGNFLLRPARSEARFRCRKGGLTASAIRRQTWRRCQRRPKCPPRAAARSRGRIIDNPHAVSYENDGSYAASRRACFRLCADRSAGSARIAGRPRALLSRAGVVLEKGDQGRSASAAAGKTRVVCDTSSC